MSSRHERGLGIAAGRSGRIVIAWTMSGGVAGGIAAPLMTLAEMMPGNELFLTVSGLYISGLIIGLFHGSVFGFFGRDEGVSPRQALGRVLIGWLYGIVGSAVSYLVALWIGFTVFAVRIPSIGNVLGTVVGWWIGVAILMWAARETWFGFKNVAKRWSDWGIAFILTTISFLVLAWFFFAYGAYVGTSGPRAAIFWAGGISVWIIGPFVTLGLLLLRRLLALEQLAKQLNLDVELRED